jgi:hypothetical protein
MVTTKRYRARYNCALALTRFPQSSRSAMCVRGHGGRAGLKTQFPLRAARLDSVQLSAVTRPQAVRRVRYNQWLAGTTQRSAQRTSLTQGRRSRMETTSDEGDAAPRPGYGPSAVRPPVGGTGRAGTVACHERRGLTSTPPRPLPAAATSSASRCWTCSPCWWTSRWW